MIFIVTAWCFFKVIEYYLIPYFFVALLWIGLSFSLLAITVIQLIKAVLERKLLTQLRVAKVIAFSLLFYLTFNSSLISGLIEKIDWRVLYDKRMEIAKQVERKELNPNVSWNDIVCELPYEFPIVSNGGNDIVIFRKKNSAITVSFWVFRNFFSAPSTSFVYTNDNEQIKQIEAQIAHDPKNNWKIKNNWYRTFGE